MKTYRVTLTPTSSINGFPASDTLFGALCWGIRAIYNEARLCDILDKFDTDRPAFVLSSSFPVLENQGERVYFYPMLCVPGPGMGDLKEMASKCGRNGLAFKISLTQATADWKRLRDVRFASHTVTDRLLNEGSLNGVFRDYHLDREQSNDNSWSPYHLGGTVKLISEDMVMSEDEYVAIFQGRKPAPLHATAITQRNRIDRLRDSTGGAGELYYSSDTRFRAESDGPALILHFLVKTLDVDFLKPVFRWLADTGIGGDRTSGRNHFLVSEPEEVAAPDAPGDVYYTLSRCLPKSGERPLMYDLLPRRNRLESSHFRGKNIWKRKVIYFREGSCFRCEDRREHYGRIQEVIEVGDHRIRQNGIAFPIFGGEGNGSEA